MEPSKHDGVRLSTTGNARQSLFPLIRSSVNFEALSQPEAKNMQSEGKVKVLILSNSCKTKKLKSRASLFCPQASAQQKLLQLLVLTCAKLSEFYCFLQHKHPHLLQTSIFCEQPLSLTSKQTLQPSQETTSSLCYSKMSHNTFTYVDYYENDAAYDDQGYLNINENNQEIDDEEGEEEEAEEEIMGNVINSLDDEEEMESASPEVGRSCIASDVVLTNDTANRADGENHASRYRREWVCSDRRRLSVSTGNHPAICEGSGQSQSPADLRAWHFI